jgi:hypothetical protein
VEISIQTSGLRLPSEAVETYREQIRLCVEQTFARIKRRVTRVSVHVEDVKGPRRAADKHCMIKVILGASGATTTLAQGRDGNLSELVRRVSLCAAKATLGRIRRRVAPGVAVAAGGAPAQRVPQA